MSRADSHDVGGEGNVPGSGVDVGGGEGTSASHENAGGDSLIRFNFNVMVQSQGRRRTTIVSKKGLASGTKLKYPPKKMLPRPSFGHHRHP